MGASRGRAGVVGSGIAVVAVVVARGESAAGARHAGVLGAGVAVVTVGGRVLAAAPLAAIVGAGVEILAVLVHRAAPAIATARSLEADRLLPRRRLAAASGGAARLRPVAGEHAESRDADGAAAQPGLAVGVVIAAQALALALRHAAIGCYPLETFLTA